MSGPLDGWLVAGLALDPAALPVALQLLTTMLAVFAAAAVSSIVGFAFAGLCGPLLHLLAEHPVRAVLIILVASVGIQCLTVWRLRHELNGEVLLAPLLGGLATLPLGVHLLFSLPTPLAGAGLGALLLAYGGWMLIGPAPKPIPERFWAPGAVIAGAMGGITGGLAAFPGAAMVIWCGLRGWPKTSQRALFQPYILVMQLATLGLMAAMAPPGTLAMLQAAPEQVAIDPSVLAQRGMHCPMVLAHLPPALLGTVLGLRLFRRLSDRGFALTVNLLLIAAGLGLIL